jgi:proline iminopeptidase
VGEVTADDGCVLWTAETGHGNPLVLCHGGPGLWDYLGDVAVLLGTTARGVRWDQRGCGRSECRGPYTVARFVADLDAVRQHIGADQVALLGHSWGAFLALRYALDHPERVTRLVYVSGTGIDPPATWHSGYEENLRHGIGANSARWEGLQRADRTDAEEWESAVLQWSAEFVDPATALREAEHLATPWFGINRECSAELNAEVRRYLADNEGVVRRCQGLDVPALIVDGAHDIRPRWAVDSLAKALPRVRRVTIAGAGHLPWVERPEEFREAVAEFLY